jgi:drug/metabolite transporter (DMT)-like permease
MYIEPARTTRRLGTKIANGPVMLLSAAVLWSFCGVMLKATDWNRMAIVSLRSLVAAVMLLAIIKRPRFTWSFPQIGATLSYVLMVIMYVFANKYTTAANAIVLEYTSPIYVAILGALFLKERVRLADTFCMAAVFAGMLACFWGSGFSGNLAGNICGLASGLSYASMTVFQRMQRESSNLEPLLLGNIIMFFIGFPFVLQQSITAEGAAMVAAMGIFQGFPYVLYSLGLKKVKAVEASLITTIEPFLNPLWVFLFIGEVPGKLTVVGGLLVVTSITLRTVYIYRSDNLKGKREAGRARLTPGEIEGD